MNRLPVIALATWRVSYMLVNERGPFAVFKRLREAQMKKRAPNDYHGYTSEKAFTELGQLLACVWCLSVWVAPLLMVVDRFAPRIVDALAISAGAILANRGASG